MTYKEVEVAVLYEDNHLLIINKPAGVLSQKDASGVDSIIEFAKKYIKIKYDRPGNVYIHPVHRLDRVVSGCLILSRTTKATQRFNKTFKEDQIDKTYLAIVQGHVNHKSERLIHYLKKDRAKNKVVVKEKKIPGYKECILEYQVLNMNGDFSLLEVKLITGRSHQIRAQLSYIGHPIGGDRKYGSKYPNPQRVITLHATCISFIHPVKKEKMVISSFPYKHLQWNYFDSYIKELKYC